MAKVVEQRKIIITIRDNSYELSLAEANEILLGLKEVLEPQPKIGIPTGTWPNPTKIGGDYWKSVNYYADSGTINTPCTISGEDTNG